VPFRLFIPGFQQLLGDSIYNLFFRAFFLYQKQARLQPRRLRVTLIRHHFEFHACFLCGFLDFKKFRRRHCQTLLNPPSFVSCSCLVEVCWPNHDFFLFAHLKSPFFICGCNRQLISHHSRLHERTRTVQTVSRCLVLTFCRRSPRRPHSRSRQASPLGRGTRHLQVSNG
jgi:hypothetical protein